MRVRKSTERARSEDGRQLKLALAPVFAAHGASHRLLAEALDIAPSLLSRRLDPAEHTSHLQLVDVARMPADLRVALLKRLLADDGFDVVATTQATDATNALRTASSLLSSAASTATQMLDACSDGVVDRREAAPLRMAAIAVRDQAATIVRVCDRAMLDGLVKMSSKGGEA